MPWSLGASGCSGLPPSGPFRKLAFQSTDRPAEAKDTTFQGRRGHWATWAAVPPSLVVDATQRQKKNGQAAPPSGHCHLILGISLISGFTTTACAGQLLLTLTRSALVWPVEPSSSPAATAHDSRPRRAPTAPLPLPWRYQAQTKQKPRARASPSSAPAWQD